MPFCFACIDYDTCQLDKRDSVGLYGVRCKSFKRKPDGSSLPLDRVERIASDLVRRLSKPPKTEIKVDVDVPMAFTTDKYVHPDVPRGLYLDFINTDFNNPEQVRKFYHKYLPKVDTLEKDDDELSKDGIIGYRDDRLNAYDFLVDYLLEGSAKDPDAISFEEIDSAEYEAKHRELLAVQEELRDLVERWCNKPESFGTVEDINKINRWLGEAMSFQIAKRRIEGKNGFVPTFTLLQRDGFFFLQFVEDVLEKQPIKRCPVCRKYYNPLKKRGPAGRTCGEPGCRTELHPYCHLALGRPR